MTDKELLELAAKAAGFELVLGKEYFIGKDKVDCTDMPYINSKDIDDLDCYWNPLIDDGDALRLAVKLDMNVYSGYGSAVAEIPNDAEHDHISSVEHYGKDRFAATRLAIVRAAAEIGKNV